MAISIAGTSSVRALAQSSNVSRTTNANDRPDPSLALLTPADRELVFQATGKEVDATSTVAPLLAFIIGIEREKGGLAGKEVDESYLQQLKTLYNGTPEGLHWIPTLNRALDYLTANKPGSGHVDIRS